MLTKADKKKIFDRIMQSATSVGLYNRTQIAQALVKVKCSITTKALHSYSSGRAAPSAETLIGLKKVLNRSIDWLLTGEETEPHDIRQIRELLDSLLAKHGATAPELDLDLQKIMTVLINLKPDQRAPLARLIEAYSKEHE